MIHLIKLCVGANNVADLSEFQEERYAKHGEVFHTTRMFPKREAELLAGGSLFWIIKGYITARQRVLALKEIRDEEGKKYCNLVISRTIVLTQRQAHRPFQGWRYLASKDAPLDAHDVDGETAKHFADLGLL